jgi:hypothetical protein
MADEASIRMTVDSSQAIAENQKYVRAATETFNILLDKSEQYTGSVQERVKFLEREIELQRESIRTAKEQQIGSIYSDPRLSSTQRREQIGAVRGEEREDLKELRELNRITKQYATDQKVAAQKAERVGESFGKFLPGIFSQNTAGGMANAGSSALLAGTVLGTLAAIGIAKEIQGAIQMEPAVRDYAVLRGSSMLGIKPDVAATKDMELGKIGMLPSQYFSNYAQLYRAGGGKVKESMLGIMEAEKATGVSRAQMGSLLSVERFGSGQVTPLISFFEKYLRTTSQSIAILPEILQTFAQEGTAMMRATGKVNTAAIAATVAVVGKQFGFTGETLQTATGALRQGLQQSGNSTIQALQFGAMSRAMPGASLWEMEKSMENPLANPKYITGFLDQLKGMTGGGEQYARSIYNVFGQYGISRNLADQLSQGQITNEDLLTEADRFRKTGAGGFRGRAEGVTGAIETATATWQGGFERTGFNTAQELGAKVTAILQGFEGLISKANENAEAQRQLSEDMLAEAKTTNSWLWRMLLRSAGSSLRTEGLPGIQ